MSDEIDEVVTISIKSNRDESIRTITNEYDVSDTCWPHLVEVFLEQLQGLGYKFFATPEEMVDVLEEFHQDLMCVECNGCDEEKAPVVEEKKYPYIGMFTNEPSAAKVLFTAPQTGYVIESNGSYQIGYFTEGWVESSFTKVSK